VKIVKKLIISQVAYSNSLQAFHTSLLSFLLPLRRSELSRGKKDVVDG